MNTDSNAAFSIFEFQVPSGREFKLSRINFLLTDSTMQPDNFGSIGGGLSNGCILQIVDQDGVILQHFATDIVPIKANADFGGLAGVDIPVIQVGAGNDLLPIRFSVFKAGASMLLIGRQRIRWTNRDDIGAIARFRGMIQGIFAI